jgi:hypothetical protein
LSGPTLTDDNHATIVRTNVIVVLFTFLARWVVKAGDRI